MQNDLLNHWLHLNVKELYNFKFMRTIDSILMYKFSREVIADMRKKGIVNWMWGKGANIETKVKAMIELLPWYDEDYKKRLYNDLESISMEHDYDYHVFNWFTWSNYQMARKVYKLLHWWGFTRLFVSLTLFLLLSRYGYKYYI